MRASSVSLRNKRRAGTLIEILVAVSCIAIIAALIIPAIQNARSVGRRTECLDHIRNLAVASQEFASSQNGRLPFLINNDASLNWGTAVTPQFTPSPWTVQLLYHVEQGPLAGKLATADNDPSTPPDSTVAGLALKRVPVFVCPDDPNRELAGNLSYAINTGYIGDGYIGNDVHFQYDPTTWRGTVAQNGHATVDYNYLFNGAEHTADDVDVARSTGVAWADAQVSIDQISRSDGTATTLLFAENLQAQRWAGRSSVLFNPTTIDYEISDISFGVPVSTVGDSYPVVVADMTSRPFDGVGTSEKAFALALQPQFRGLITGQIDGRINSNKTTALEGKAQRPSSTHDGGVNVVFVAGNGKFLSQTIDTTLYARLVTWDGARKGQLPISNKGF